MGGGLMQLVAYGAQDVYLTGNAQITFFKVVYRRHTNFAIEMNELPIDLVRPGGNFSVQILRNGDLATRMYLHLRTQAVTTDNVSLTPPDNTIDVSLDASEIHDNPKVAFVRRLGHAAINYVKVQVGGTDIDEHYGIWLDLWYELTHLEGQTRGYRKLIGDVPELTTLSGWDGVNSTILPETELFIPMQFWFNRNPGLALPLIALQYHDVRLYFSMNEVSTLFVWSGDSAPKLSGWQFASSGLMVDYIYLDADERRRFAQVGHEYLIEQNQEYDTVPATQSNQSKNNFILQFNHPCKEFVFANQCGAFCSGATGGRNTFLCYSSSDLGWGSALDYAAANILAGAIYTGRGNNDAAFCNKLVATSTSKADNIGSSNNQSWNNLDLSGAVTGNGTTLYDGKSAVTNSTITIPSGKKIYVSIAVTNNSGTAYDYNAAGNGKYLPVNVNALIQTAVPNLNYLNPLARTFDSPYAQAIISVTIHNGTNGYVANTVTLDAVTVTGHSLDMNWVSIPVQDLTDNRFGSVVAKNNSGVNSSDVHVIQPQNYGLHLDGTGNPVLSGQVKLNGQQRFDLVSGNYFNYVQPYQHHTRTPADGINVYSFALNPETHQPSGTANLSRIDTTELYLTLGQYQTSTPLQTNVPHNDSWYKGSTFYVFTQNYNVFRIMSGMGGLAYSN